MYDTHTHTHTHTHTTHTHTHTHTHKHTHTHACAHARARTHTHSRATCIAYTAPICPSLLTARSLSRKRNLDTSSRDHRRMVMSSDPDTIAPEFTSRSITL
jgi:hypothetical protein